MKIKPDDNFEWYCTDNDCGSSFTVTSNVSFLPDKCPFCGYDGIELVENYEEEGCEYEN